MGVNNKSSTTDDLAGIDDPIALSMQDRIKAGGLSAFLQELDAKKKGIRFFRAPKHFVKAGATLVNLVEDPASLISLDVPA